MKLSTIYESLNKKKLVVVYGGRFQPFHLGHFKAYEWLINKFGKENVWIGTSNKTNLNSSDGKVSPFNFKEKIRIMFNLYNIDPKRVIECKNAAFKPIEIFQLYRGYKIIYITAVGEKNVSRYKQNDFYNPLPKKVDVESLDTLDSKKGYFIEIPTQQNNLSATEIRSKLIKTDGKKHEELFKKYFGKYDNLLDQFITNRLKEIK